MTRNLRLVVGAVIAIVFIGVVVSQFASSEPDGLEFVAEQEGFADTAEDHALEDAPLADYGDSGGSRALAAVVGIVASLGVGYVLFKVIGTGDKTEADAEPERG